jgi:hypothetical protein
MTKEEYPLNSLNEYTHDLDSWRTGKGKHCRTLVCMCCKTKRIEGRVDLAEGLPMPTESDVRKIARFEGWRPSGKFQIDGQAEVTVRGQTRTSVWFGFGEDTYEKEAIRWDA